MSAVESTFTVLIADDEAPARHLLREYLAREPGYRNVGEAKNGREAIELAESLRPNLVLLDVDMPALDGFEVLPFLPPETAVIFITAHDAFALRAFEVHAVDYILKPVSELRFGEALRRATLRLKSAAPGPPKELKRDVRPPEQTLERIVIRDGSRVDVVPLADIEYIEAQDDYVEVNYRGRSSLAPETLAALENSLDPQKFVRIHRSFLVHLKFMDCVKTLGPGKKVVVLKDGRELPVSRSGDSRLRGILGR
jgi:two-component system, LytTR family, response regulator